MKLFRKETDRKVKEEEEEEKVLNRCVSEGKKIEWLARSLYLYRSAS